MKRIDLNNSSIKQQSYLFYGGETIVIPVFANDQLDIVDKEGHQPCWLQCFDQHKTFNQTIVTHTDPKQNASSSEFSDFFTIHSPQQQAYQQTLAGFNLPATDQAQVVLAADSQAHTNTELTVQGTGFLAFFALGAAMALEGGSVPSAIYVTVTRHTAFESFPLPEPLGKTKQEIYVPESSARSFSVAKGDYIQIIDIQGQQSSDFQCFAESDLANNRVTGIDPTVTRTMIGHAYPMPGLYSKYYDDQSTPLVEVVQDTVGRHDTFGLACNSKYYEDMGYFGHANCTDNFNQALTPYSIPARKNWVAVNLFFNTDVEECRIMSVDEPWSRPGDYVMFKALTDLVCVSSACPDDIDPANGWNPTDIHVRVYDGESHQLKPQFKPSIAFRSSPRALPVMTKETGFHAQFAQHTRNFTEYNGYWLANDFTNYGAVAEYYGCRERVAVMDLSPLKKFEVIGEDAEQLLQYVLTRNIRKLAVGQVVYSAMCYENGGMIDDGTLFRLAPNNFRWIGGCDASGEWLRKVALEKGLKVTVKSSTDQLHNIAVQGPKSRELLKTLFWCKPLWANMDEMGWFRFSIGRLHSETGTPIMISRTGYSGELGYEVFCHPKDAAEVWQAVWDAGQPHGIVPLGLEALDMLRIEAGLIFADYEFNDQTDPIEAGIGFTVPLKSKEENFIGRKAIEVRKANPQYQLVGLELSGDEVALHGDGVYDGKQQIGVITSATRSPILQKNIALCRISTHYSALGTHVEIGKLDGQQKRLTAKVIAFPFYDPDKSRVRA